MRHVIRESQYPFNRRMIRRGEIGGRFGMLLWKAAVGQLGRQHEVVAPYARGAPSLLAARGVCSRQVIHLGMDVVIVERCVVPLVALPRIAAFCSGVSIASMS